MNYSTIEYPALIYKNSKSHVFVANCIIKKIIGFGKTESEAIDNLQALLNNTSDEYFVKVKPLYQLAV